MILLQKKKKMEGYCVNNIYHYFSWLITGTYFNLLYCYFPNNNNNNNE